MIIQVDPTTARMSCPLCNVLTEITLTLRPVLVEAAEGQMGVRFELAHVDDEALWEHVLAEHRDEYERDFPGGAKRGVL